MSRRTVWIVVVVVAALALLILLPLFRPGAIHEAGPGGLVGQPAPVFALYDDRGNPVSLAAYHGKVVVLNLWASWCPPCRAEMPDLQRLQKAYASRGLVVVGVNQGESPQRAAEFAKALQIDFPIWIDDQQQYGRVFAALGLPTTVIIGPDGFVRRGFDGALTLDQMRAAVSPFLAGA